MQGQSQHQVQVPIKVILGHIQSKWYIFLVSAIVALGLAYLFIKRSNPVYQITSSLVIEDKSGNSSGNNQFMKEMGILSEGGAIDDEIGILSSYSLISKTIEQMDLGYSFYKQELFPTRVSNRAFPYVIKIDSSQLQIADTKIKLTVADDGSLRLESEVEKGFLFDPKTQEVVTPLEDVEVEISGKLGQPIKHKYFSGTISRSPDALEDDEVYLFAIRSIASLTENFKENLIIEPTADKSNILQFVYEGSVIDEGVKFLDNLMNTYIVEDVEKKTRKGKNTIAFIESQISGASDSLKEVENVLESFQSQGQVIDVESSAKLLFEQRTKLEEDLTQRKMTVNNYQYIYDRLRTAGSDSEVIAPAALDKQDPVLSNLLIELSSLQREKARTSLTAVENSPQVAIFDAQIKSQKEAIEEHINNNLVNAKNALSDVRIRIARLENDITKLPGQQKKLAKIQRDYDFSEDQYKYLFEKKAEAGIALASNKSESYVLDKARLNGPDPISPKKSLILLFALIVGMGVPAIMFIGLELFNDKIGNRKDLELSTDIPVLGIIIKSDQWNKVISPATEHTRLTESFRSARVQLQYLVNKGDDALDKVIGVTSSSPNEGKSFCAANFAATLALSGKKTLLMDLDLRKPDLKEYFTYNNSVGLHGYLTESHRYTSLLTKIENINNLWIFPSGPSTPKSLDLLDSAKFKKLMTNLKKRYDHIILDTPPIGHTSDYYIIKDMVDFTIYVVRHNQTSSQALGRVNQLYEDNTLGNMGILINGVKDVGGYNYGEGASYGYGRNSYGYSAQHSQGSKPVNLKDKILSVLRA
ncbi:MAG: polysaccharide biosynthesis tyrosine autokinase [Bacteroidota bacterium]